MMIQALTVHHDWDRISPAVLMKASLQAIKDWLFVGKVTDSVPVSVWSLIAGDDLVFGKFMKEIEGMISRNGEITSEFKTWKGIKAGHCLFCSCLSKACQYFARCPACYCIRWKNRGLIDLRNNPYSECEYLSVVFDGMYRSYWCRYCTHH